MGSSTVGGAGAAATVLDPAVDGCAQALGPKAMPIASENKHEAETLPMSPWLAQIAAGVHAKTYQSTE
jgi:hypothetical protein